MCFYLILSLCTNDTQSRFMVKNFNVCRFALDWSPIIHEMTKRKSKSEIIYEMVRGVRQAQVEHGMCVSLSQSCPPNDFSPNVRAGLLKLARNCQHRVGRNFPSV